MGSYGDAAGASLGSTAAATREVTCERPGNSWLFAVGAIQNAHQVSDI